ncbi:MAG: hypothetical protein IJP03_03995 [Christensenellaceae bacterium]|nr:hypothetical protein [Christensenellaceae bacterium]
MKKIKVDAGKLLLYIFGKLLGVALAVGMAVFALVTALNSTNVYVMTKDAFTKRNSVILEPIDNPDTAMLDKLFTDDFLRSTQLDTQKTNASYEITNYDERISITYTAIFPWQDSAEIKVKNVVQDIKAKISSSAMTFEPVDEFIESGTYIVRVVKDENGGWKVDSITLEEKIIPESVLPIPTPEPVAEETGEESEGTPAESEGEPTEE